MLKRLRLWWYSIELVPRAMMLVRGHGRREINGTQDTYTLDFEGLSLCAVINERSAFMRSRQLTVAWWAQVVLDYREDSNVPHGHIYVLHRGLEWLIKLAQAEMAFRRASADQRRSEREDLPE